NPDHIQKRIRKQQHDKVKRCVKKSFRDCTDFSVSRHFNRFISVQRAREQDLALILADPDKAIEGCPQLKMGGSSTISQVESPQGPVVIKRYNLTSWLYAFSRLWRPSRAWNSWKAGLRLKYLHLQTPEPLAMIESRWGPLRRKAWIITEFCSGTPLLDHLNPDIRPSGKEAAEIISLFKTLHRERISHGDFKATNLFWHNDRISVIDLDSMKQHRFKFTYRRAWKKDRVRLLRNWPTESPLHQWLDETLPPE
ncbi:MAG: lipopolysaccharide kinase InaA family protein, partial [Kiritimatiellaceae bacterium]|nr:lipopolysaccharide kinase InaA family protein [Kiritimatiellaceae bacterium]